MRYQKIIQTEHNEYQHIVVRTRWKRRCRRSGVKNALHKIAIATFVSAGLLGVGALGCWGVEIIAANANPTSISSYHWQALKNICIGAMLVGLSGCLGTALVGGVLGGVDE